MTRKYSNGLMWNALKYLEEHTTLTREHVLNFLV